VVSCAQRRKVEKGKRKGRVGTSGECSPEPPSTLSTNRFQVETLLTYPPPSSDHSNDCISHLDRRGESPLAPPASLARTGLDHLLPSLPLAMLPRRLKDPVRSRLYRPITYSASNNASPPPPMSFPPPSFPSLFSVPRPPHTRSYASPALRPRTDDTSWGSIPVVNVSHALPRNVRPMKATSKEEENEFGNGPRGTSDWLSPTEGRFREEGVPIVKEDGDPHPEEALQQPSPFVFPRRKDAGEPMDAPACLPSLSSSTSPAPSDALLSCTPKGLQSPPVPAANSPLTPSSPPLVPPPPSPSSSSLAASTHQTLRFPPAPETNPMRKRTRPPPPSPLPTNPNPRTKADARQSCIPPPFSRPGRLEIAKKFSRLHDISTKKDQLRPCTYRTRAWPGCGEFR
jgi:hypothetical protein